MRYKLITKTYKIMKNNVLNFKQVRKTIFIALIAFLLASCSSYKYGQNAEPTQKSNLTFGVVKSKIEKGKTTQAEILNIFGSPNLVTKNKSNDEVWSYNRMSVQERAGSSGVVVSFLSGATTGGARASASTSSQSFDLIITFDENDVVKDYSVISTSF